MGMGLSEALGEEKSKKSKKNILRESGIDILVDGGDGVARIEADARLLIVGDACIAHHDVVCTLEAMLCVRSIKVEVVKA